jgi:hypothetical protein
MLVMGKLSFRGARKPEKVNKSRTRGRKGKWKLGIWSLGPS